MPLNKALASLQIDGPDSRPSSARSSARGPSSLEKQESFDLSATNTFSAEAVRIRGSSGLEDKPVDREYVSLGDLQRGKTVGRGASGRVVLMKHKATGEQYALKELAALADSDARRQAQNELRIAQRHASATDHLVGLIDAYFVDDKICILMEFCDGGSLEQAFQHAADVKGLPLGPIALQMSLGMRYMHREMKQVHRDLKPGNVLLTSSGVVKRARSLAVPTLRCNEARAHV